MSEETKKEQPIDPEVVGENEDVYKKYKKEEENKQKQKEETPLEKVDSLANKLPNNTLAILAFVFACVSFTFVNTSTGFYGYGNWITYLVLFILSVVILPLPLVGLIFANKSLMTFLRNPYRVFARIARILNILTLTFIAVNTFVYLILFICFLIGSF